MNFSKDFNWQHLQNIRAIDNLNLGLLYELLYEREARQKVVVEVKANERRYRDYFSLWLHRIKNPLAVLRIQNELQSSPRQEIIERNLIAVERYVGLAFAYVKMQGAEDDLDLRNFELKELVESVIKRLADYQQMQAVTLKLSLEPTAVLADQSRLAVALEEFLNNAYKYGRGGQVVLDLKNYILEISDEGPGMSEVEMEKVGRFAYSAAKIEKQSESTGLGLYLAKVFLSDLNVGYDLGRSESGGLKVTLDLSSLKADSYKNVSIHD
ncbi:MAG: HAMP domain-containing sensor histidine kinase [Eubacteriales bacterium]|nr:HAMP domain-containing sensor histidine kinase [Eubacteriales bacterium]